MKNRMNIHSQEPASMAPMMGLETYLESSDLSPKLRQLIKIRASILNNCAYCIQMHTEEAEKLGESHARLFALAAWQESPLFTEQERAILKLTDEITCLSNTGVSDETYAECESRLGKQVLAQCIMQIVTINAWNRIAVSTKLLHD